MRKSVLLVLLFLTAGLWPARAQFYSAGDDPGYLRWYTLETPYYQIIYPQGTDSLARTYARLLEQFRVPIGRSLGQTPGMGQRRKMPIVLHTHHPYSNGSVGWAPARMDLYTIPTAYNPEPIPWEIQLASHEPRHQAQMQWGGSKGYLKVLKWLSGEAWQPVAWQFYLDFPFGEGDAVVAETGLASGTRARTADFLSYYRVALDQGDYRSWERWRFGSYRQYTPNHYALGYITLAGVRYLESDPFIMQKALEKSRLNPLRISPYNFRKTVKEVAGKPFDAEFREIQDTLLALWRANDGRRGPFQPMEQVSPAESFSTDYSSPQWANGQLLALRKGFLHPAELVRIDEKGKVHTVRPFASSASDLFVDRANQRLYWSETLPDGRWSLDGSSIIRYYDLSSGKFYDLTRHTRLYNPEVSPDGKLVAAAEYPVTGGSAVVVLDAQNGQMLRRIATPDGLQAYEMCWLGSDLYVSGVCTAGCGIYKIGPEGQWKAVMQPSVQTVSCMNGGEDFVEWVSDRTSVNELYRYYPATGKLLQMTSTRYGGIDFIQQGDYLYFVSQTLDGDMIFRTPIQDLQPREVDYADVCEYPVEEEITRQERSLGPAPDLSSAVPMSAPKRFRKLSNTRFHSWLPLYVNYDDVKSGSMDFSYETASLGVSGFFQNTLGTFSGMLGYGFHQDPDIRDHWRSSLHAKAVFSMWYPVLEASLDAGDRNARQYSPLLLQDQGETGVYTVTNRLDNTPSVTATLRAYIPLSYYKGGYLYGFTPQVQYSLANDHFALHPVHFTRPQGFEDVPSGLRVVDLGEPGSAILQRLTASLRGYVMLPRADSQPYPSWGLGLEGGVSYRPGLGGLFTPNVYAYAYGYTPGLFRTQGLHFSLTYQEQLDGGKALFPETAVSILPRGFSGGASSAVAQNFPRQWKVALNYAIPFSFGDISIPYVAYIKNFTLTPHADFTGLAAGYNLWSAGVNLTASLGRLLVFPLGTTLGVSFSYLGGSFYEYTGQGKPYSVSMIFDFDLF